VKAKIILLQVLSVILVLSGIAFRPLPEKMVVQNHAIFLICLFGSIGYIHSDSLENPYCRIQTCERSGNFTIFIFTAIILTHFKNCYLPISYSKLAE